MWRFITPAFETSYKIVLIDLVGSGNLINAYDFDKYNTLKHTQTIFLILLRNYA
jgi:sigma-B regulation protein RsbQ